VHALRRAAHAGRGGRARCPHYPILTIP
jgi:hypothetical protein